MANRSFAAASYSNVKDRVRLTAAVAFNATSAPTLMLFNPDTGKYTAAPSAGDGYFTAFTRTGVGLYTLTPRDSYIRLLGGSVMFVSNTNAVAPIWEISVASDPTLAQAFGSAVGAGSVRSGTLSIKFVFYSAAATPADPAATEIALLTIDLQNSAGR